MIQLNFGSKLLGREKKVEFTGIAVDNEIPLEPHLNVFCNKVN